MPHQCTNCGRTFADGSKEMLSGCPDCGGNKFQFSPDSFGDASGSSAGTAESPPDGSEPPSPPDRPGDAVSRTVGSAAATVRDIVGGSGGPDATEARPPESTGSRSTADADGDRSIAPSGDDRSTTGDGRDGALTPDPDDPATGFSDVEPGSDDDIIVAESTPPEDAAQADARSGLADPDELSAADETDTDDASDAAATSGDGGSPAGRGDANTSSDVADGDRTVVEEPDAERTERPDLATLREELNEQFESIRVVEPGQYELNLMELYDREAYIIALQEDGRYSIQMPETWREADA